MEHLKALAAEIRTADDVKIYSGAKCRLLTAHEQDLIADSIKEPTAAPLGYVLVDLARINHLISRIKDLADAGSRDAKSLAVDAALLLEANRG